MKAFFFTAALLVVSLPAISLMAAAHEYAAENIQIDHPWARPTVTTSQPAAVFFTLNNQGGEADRLIGAKVDASIAEGVELHTTLNEDGVMRMRRLSDGLTVPAGEIVPVQPGGHHLMLFKLTQPLEEGDRFALTLVFEKAGDVEVEVAVEVQAEHGPAMDHSAHGS